MDSFNNLCTIYVIDTLQGEKKMKIPAKLLGDSVVIWFAWFFTLLILNISYTNDIITDAMLGDWTMLNLMIFVSYIWLAFYFIWVLLWNPNIRFGGRRRKR